MTENHLAAIGLALMAFTAPATAKTSPVECELTVKGESYIKGRCTYSPSEDGSFQIDGNGYFARVQVTGKNVAEANWNESPGSTHAHSYLGTVKRTGACWSNATATICARALPTAETKAAVAAQPDGMMLWPDIASGACIGVEGPLQDGATPVLHTCKIPNDLIFEAAADGTLSIEKHKNLCIDIESPGMSKPPQLVLLTCHADSPKWRFGGRTGESATVQSSDGLCWTISRQVLDSNPNFPWPIVTQSCATVGDQALKLNLSKD